MSTTAGVTTNAEPRTVHLHPSDNLVMAVDPLPAGATIRGVTAAQRVGRGHKMAIAPVAEGETLLKFGQVIGFASQPIAPGEWVHEHNVTMREFARDYRFAEAARVEEVLPPAQQATFQGYRRANGSVGTRNYLAVLTSVNCSATVARMIAREIEKSDILADYPNIDGVIPLVHGTGCAMDLKGEGYEMLKRTQWGYAANPNMAGVLMVGLGCEAFQIGAWKSAYGITESDTFRSFTIQDIGGTRKAIEGGVEAIRAMLPMANAVKRETVPASELMLALQCGGSDGYSGITANPALGAAVDLLVRHGGTAILSETPEIYGAEHMLTRRAATREVGEKLVGMIHWWEEYTARNGGEMNNNPSPGNKAGGLTTILEKSLGRRGEGRHDDVAGRVSLCRAGDGKGFRVHGHARLRPGVGDRAGGGRRQCAVLHHRPRLGLWLQADAFDQAGDQHRDVPPHERGHGHQLRRHPRWRAGGAEGPRNLRDDPARGVRRAVKVRIARLWRRRVRAVAGWGRDVMGAEQTMSETIHGLWVAMATPVAADGSVDHAALVGHAKGLMAAGCDGLVPFGTTGEGTSFSAAERLAAIEAMLAGGIAPGRIAPGTGCPAITDTIALTRSFLGLGLHHVLILPPYYYRDVDAQGIEDAFAAIIDGVADSRLRATLYNIPQVSGVPVPPEVAGRLRQRFGDDAWPG